MGPGLVIAVLNVVVGIAVVPVTLYWVIRLAVRHALMDMDDRRARGELEADS